MFSNITGNHQQHHVVSHIQWLVFGNFNPYLNNTGHFFMRFNNLSEFFMVNADFQPGHTAAVARRA